ncbi:O-acetylhomoserine/O-acetylserine sulfhydrylase [Cordyceps militaris CM01]|uniref:O-acetylhomoserine/O-acetylserine sulfhydrylase n=1 Tax=Cordyceps militaris (strain CM01) TaxID=983644 RepID=G3J8J7_CORMM|nr:O-acetylhomoserine/O-acetylserine sulfhydrylase [Cordyceps militaris CM01]EGX94784.1 O-acetylhomoserine/O-acetylserine sulfhydrylase [Cordyceps militaris CM01]
MANTFVHFKLDVDKESRRRFSTRQVHAGATPDPNTKARAVPIYATASYVFTNSEHARRVCSNEEAGYVYSRIANPTVEVLEKRVASLEGGTAAVACASGQAAAFQTILCLASSGENIVSSTNLYGGTYSMFKTLLPRIGISVRWVNDDDPRSFQALTDEKTKLYYLETVGNPRISVPDMAAIAELAHAHTIPFVVDNTFGAGGFWCPVIDYGADIVIHSATKWLGGHGTTVGGVVVDSGRFDWSKTGGKFPVLTHPAGSTVEVSYATAYGNCAFALAVRIEGVMKVGGVMNPFAAQQILLGIETLSLRCERIGANALRVATYLSSSPKIEWVSYPGKWLSTDRYHSMATKYMRRGYGGVLSFGLRGGTTASRHFVDALDLISNMTNVGDCKTMATHPWSSTHSLLSEKDRIDAGVTEDLIRLSIGTEDCDDILADIRTAFEAIPQTAAAGGSVEETTAWVIAREEMTAAEEMAVTKELAAVRVITTEDIAAGECEEITTPEETDATGQGYPATESMDNVDNTMAAENSTVSVSA